MQVQTTKIGKAYAAYTFFKFVGAAILLLVVGMGTKAEVENYYTPSNCQHCAEQAMINPNVLYEYGKCSMAPFGRSNALTSTGEPEAAPPPHWTTEKNLLKEPSRWGDSPLNSRVSSYVLDTAIVLGGGIIIGCLAGLPAFSAQFDMTNLLIASMYASILYMGFLMFVANRVFELYQDPTGCYVSALPATFHFAEFVIWTIYILTVFIGCCFGLLTDSYGTVCTGTAYLVMIVYSFYSLVAGARNLMETTRPWHMLFNVLAFLSTWEIPIVFSGLAGLFLCFGFRAAQSGRGVETSQLRGLLTGIFRSDDDHQRPDGPPNRQQVLDTPEVGAFEERGIPATQERHDFV